MNGARGPQSALDEVLRGAYLHGRTHLPGAKLHRILWPPLPLSVLFSINQREGMFCELMYPCISHNSWHAEMKIVNFFLMRRKTLASPRERVWWIHVSKPWIEQTHSWENISVHTVQHWIMFSPPCNTWSSPFHYNVRTTPCRLPLWCHDRQHLNLNNGFYFK